jgi:molecular chaperone HtpG
VSEEQYEEFYKQALAGFDKPLSVVHTKAEGVMEYASVLFIPEKAAFDLFAPDRKHGVKLYVKRVFIMDDCKELLPEYLRFVKGIVDSEDLPLNISREMLQQNPVIGKIRKTLVGKTLGKLKDIAEEESEKYAAFWEQFGPVLKEGIHIDYENKDKLLELVRFQSSMGDTKSDLVSLKQYVERMREDQKDIYYITGESREIVEKSPHLEVFREKSIEVLYLVDPVDEFIVPDIHTFEDKKLVSVTRGDLDLGELGKEEKKEKKKIESKFKKLSERIKNILSDSVKEVRTTTRLKDSPCCLVADENDMGAHMEKLMKAMGQTYAPQQRILEINGGHPILKNMNALYEKDPKEPLLEEWSRLLYDQALISEGQPVPDATAYSKLVNDLLVRVSSEVVGEQEGTKDS